MTLLFCQSFQLDHIMEGSECWDNYYVPQMQGGTYNSATPGQSSWSQYSYSEYPINSSVPPEQPFPPVNENAVNMNNMPAKSYLSDDGDLYQDPSVDPMKQSRVLELSEELKQMTLDALKNVEKDFSFRDSSSYSSQNMKSTEKYQVNQGHLVIKGTSYAKQYADSDLGMKYLISKLSR